MKVIYGSIGHGKPFNESVCATLGNFDGVHLGHQKLINECINQGLKSVIFTFNPHPNCVIKTKFEYEFLTPLDRKIELIRKLKPDYLFIINFDLKAASCQKDQFIKWLKMLNVKKIVCGEDYKFGHLASGNVTDLKKEFEVIVVNNELDMDKRISSTRIKGLLALGCIEQANRDLGRPYFIEGVVVHGQNIGGYLGFPTANIDIFGNTAPKKGVYAVKIKAKGKMYYGMANIGNNPTLNLQLNNRLEVHLFDFNDNLYDEYINIYFLSFIRDEKKFASKEELIAQLEHDKKEIKQMIKDRFF